MDVVLLHSGVTDSGEWDDVRPRLEEAGHHVLAPDLPGYGNTPLEPGELSLADFVLGLGFERAALVGTSFGGRAALEAALAAPQRIERLVVIGSNPFGWGDDVSAVGAEEEELFEAGRYDEAAELMVSAWLDGPHRGPDALPAALRDRVRAMQKRAYELGAGVDASFLRVEIEPSQVRVPTLVLHGRLDWDDVARAAARLAAEIPGAREAVIEEAAHLSTMELPERVGQELLDFFHTGTA